MIRVREMRPFANQFAVGVIDDNDLSTIIDTLGVFPTAAMAELFRRALALLDAGAPIGEDLDDPCLAGGGTHHWAENDGMAICALCFEVRSA